MIHIDFISLGICIMVLIAIIILQYFVIAQLREENEALIEELILHDGDTIIIEGDEDGN